jgi:3-oxoacyl-[acyl-carrier-protein] synthase-3
LSYSSVIVGSGGYLPGKILTNQDLEKIVDTTDEWISTRTGIKQRYIAAENELTSDMAAQAARVAINDSGLTAEDIDLIIVATTTPDSTFPSVATKVQHKLGITKGAAFDVQAVCAGFIYALSIADSFIKIGQAKNVLVIGAEKMSTVLDWQDRTTCVLFGDGAGAVVLSAEKDNPTSGIIGSKILSDGRFGSILQTNGGVAENQCAGVIKMLGQEVFKHAVEKMSSVAAEVLSENNLSLNDINYLIPHQANIRILESVAKKLQVPAEKVIVTVDQHANTSAASIPLAIAANKDKFKKGDLIALSAIGGGLCWGACLLRW